MQHDNIGKEHRWGWDKACRRRAAAPNGHHLADYELDLVDLTGCERVIARRALPKPAVESSISRIAHAPVELLAIPYLAGSGQERFRVKNGRTWRDIGEAACIKRAVTHAVIGVLD